MDSTVIAPDNRVKKDRRIETVNKKRTIIENGCALFVGLIAFLGVLYFFTQRKNPYDELTPPYNTLAREHYKMETKLEDYFSIAEQEGIRMPPEAAQEIFGPRRERGRALLEHFKALSSQSEGHDRIIAEIQAIIAQKGALIVKSKETLADQEAGGITLEEASKGFTVIRHRNNTLLKRLKALLH